jgi:hypothetical protein
MRTHCLPKRKGEQWPAICEIWCDYITRSEPYGASEGEIEHSKAISLKRIADAAEVVASCVMSGFGDPPEFNTSSRS